MKELIVGAEVSNGNGHGCKGGLDGEADTRVNPDDVFKTKHSVCATPRPCFTCAFPPTSALAPVAAASLLRGAPEPCLLTTTYW